MAELAPCLRFFFRLCFTFSPLTTSSATPRTLFMAVFLTAFFIAFPVSDFAAFIATGAIFLAPADRSRPIHLYFNYINIYKINKLT